MDLEAALGQQDTPDVFSGPSEPAPKRARKELADATTEPEDDVNDLKQTVMWEFIHALHRSIPKRLFHEHVSRAKASWTLWGCAA